MCNKQTNNAEEVPRKVAMLLDIYEGINAPTMCECCNALKKCQQKFNMRKHFYSGCYFRCFCILLTSVKSVSNTREGEGQGRRGRTENVQLVRRKVNLWNIQFVKNFFLSLKTEYSIRASMKLGIVFKKNC